MKEGTFREDLYYRLNVVRIELPLCAAAKRGHSPVGGPVRHPLQPLEEDQLLGITAEALSLLMAHDWPGNIREVENAIEHAFILCHEGYIGLRHLPEELRARGSGESLGVISVRRMISWTTGDPYGA
jgi:transcriptional regulator of acetoin/glycerol metabolism